MAQKKAKKIIKVRDLMPATDARGGGHHRHRHASALHQNHDRDHIPGGGYGIHQPQYGIKTLASRTVVRFSAVRSLLIPVRLPPTAE
jgi:hypothetical protein